MFIHYLKTAYRQYKSNRFFSLINIIGLAVAMAVCFIIFLYASHEFSFDRFHEKSSSIYRINNEIISQGQTIHAPVTSAPMGPDLSEQIPEILSYTRVQTGGDISIFKDDEYYNFSNPLIADENFFKLFSFRLLEGNPATVLSEPRSVVLNKETANMFFPDGSSPLGQTLRLNDQDGWKITGVIENCPKNSHLQYDILTSFETLRAIGQNVSEWDAFISFNTYVELGEGFNMPALNDKTTEVVWERINKRFEQYGTQLILSYVPITSIRLHSDLNYEMVETGTITKVRWFLLIAIFILFIAGFNYVNLTIASSNKRAKETGLRKVVGADKPMIRKQFFLETIIITGISFFISLLIAELLIPQFNMLLGTELALATTPWWVFGITFMIFVIFFGFAAGIYPAFYMAKFQPALILKGNTWIKPGSFSLRKILLAMQFVVSVGLIICTLVVYLQLNFFRTQDYGFSHDNLLAMRVGGQTNDKDSELLKQRLASYPWVESISRCSSFPGIMEYQEGFEFEDSPNPMIVHHMQADRHYLEALKASLTDGRFFNAEDGTELESAVINQELARRVGWTDPVGKTLTRNERRFRVIGVVQDYHFESFHNPVAPLVITALGHRLPYTGFWVLIRHDQNASAEVIPTIEKEWQSIFPDRAIHYRFISQIMGGYYEVENNFGKLFLIFSSLAIIIAMLGVLGLSAMSARQRMKEIAVRKILGASDHVIVKRFSYEYMALILVAAIIAIPLAYYLMDKWLAGFSYTISFPYWTFAAGLIITGVLCLLIVSIQSLRAISRNPVDTLKAE